MFDSLYRNFASFCSKAAVAIVYIVILSTNEHQRGRVVFCIKSLNRNMPY